MTDVERTLQELNTGVVALASICADFFDAETADRGATAVPQDDVPEPYRSLLVHNEHMTTTLVLHHNQPVELEVLEERFDLHLYARKILLRLEGGDVVEFGIARLNLALVDPPVRQEIRKRKTPLGDILIRHNVMRRIDPKWYFRFDKDSPFTTHFANNGQAAAYGRVGIIHCNGQPAIQLLEVVTDAGKKA